MFGFIPTDMYLCSSNLSFIFFFFEEEGEHYQKPQSKHRVSDLILNGYIYKMTLTMKTQENTVEEQNKDCKSQKKVEFIVRLPV